MTILDNKLVRYFFTGGTAGIVDVGSFALLHAAQIPIALSAIGSFCMATIVNYLLTCRFVFKQPASLRAYGLFFVAALGGLAVNVSVTLIGSFYLSIPPVLSKIVGIATAFLLNFWVNQRFVFRASAEERNR